MTTTLWILNTVGLLATTVGVLVVFLHLHRTSSAIAPASLPEVCQPLLKDRRMLTITVGLMAAWFVVQYVAVLFT
ncbi:MAG: hypothetical protein QOD26_1563 [Betaproteobacteria bacterium]|jgi:hypothetical protein|nr:hypothetical protein [Betaproteobacteria bacterium]